MPATTRRRFLASSLALGCSAAASPLITPIAFASLPTDSRLVVIILRGGMDGLDVVRPAADPELARLRPRLARNADQGLALDDRFTLHPALDDLAPLWRDGALAFAHAVSTPYRDKRSHFDGQDILEAGTPGLPAGAGRSGWLNRLVSLIPGATGQTAYAVGREDLLILEGPAPFASWSPDARLPLTPQGRLLLETIYRDDPLFAAAAAQAMALAERDGPAMPQAAPGMDMTEMAADAPRPAPARASRADRLAAFAGGRLNAEARIAAFSLTGWDTHRNQPAALPRALKMLSRAIRTLQAELGPNWRHTAVLAVTEFGRTAAENGSGGTDHGTGGAMLMAGGALAGGRVHGDWPGLGEGALYEGRDLMPTADLRAYAGAAIAGLFGLPRARIEQVIFPGLDMGSAPRIIG